MPSERLEFIAPMPRLRDDGATWVAELRRLEDLGFDTVAVSHHLTNGWQLAPVTAMAYAAASTTRLRVQTLVVQNPLQHPALLARDIATIDRLSGGRVELGIGAGWLAADYAALGIRFEPTPTRIAQLAEAISIIRDFFTNDTVEFAGEYYRVANLEALPRCVQQPNPPILVGAGGPRMLDLAGRCADIVGVQSRMVNGSIDHETVGDLSVRSLEAKIARIRKAAADVGREAPRLQFSVPYLHVTDSETPPRHSGWAKAVVAQMDTLAGSPAALVGTAAQCAEKIHDHSQRLGIGYWHLGQDTEAAGRIIALLRQGGVG